MANFCHRASGRGHRTQVRDKSGTRGRRGGGGGGRGICLQPLALPRGIARLPTHSGCSRGCRRCRYSPDCTGTCRTRCPDTRARPAGRSTTGCAQMAEPEVERIRYAAALSKRQFNRVDPDNRLVAGDPEPRRECALTQVWAAGAVRSRLLRAAGQRTATCSDRSPLGADQNSGINASFRRCDILRNSDSRGGYACPTDPTRSRSRYAWHWTTGGTGPPGRAIVPGNSGGAGGPAADGSAQDV
jgi:hypothetical protein